MGIKAPAKASAKAPAKAPAFDPSTFDNFTATAEEREACRLYYQDIHPLFGRAKVDYVSATKFIRGTDGPLRIHLPDMTTEEATRLFDMMDMDLMRYSRGGGHIHITPRDKNRNLAGGILCYSVPTDISNNTGNFVENVSYCKVCMFKQS